MTYTEVDFERLTWHDCHIWAIELRPGDPDQGDWNSDLALDIDFIAEWICGVGGSGQFRVAPATLAFHGVTDPKIDIDWGRSGFQVDCMPPPLTTAGFRAHHPGKESAPNGAVAASQRTSRLLDMGARRV
jgi:hypothetical protein